RRGMRQSSSCWRSGARRKTRARATDVFTRRQDMIRFALAVALSSALAVPLAAQDAESLAGKRVVFLGDSNTQAGGYVAVTAYYLEKLYPKKDFDVIGLGLASEKPSGCGEGGHAGGQFPRPCLFERLDRLLEKAKPEVVFACYGMNDGIYLPLDKERFAAFQKGVTKLIERCQKAGAKQVFLVTPPIYWDAIIGNGGQE